MSLPWQDGEEAESSAVWSSRDHGARHGDLMASILPGLLESKLLPASPRSGAGKGSYQSFLSTTSSPACTHQRARPEHAVCGGTTSLRSFSTEFSEVPSIPGLESQTAPPPGSPL